MTEIIHATTISSLKKDQSKAGKAKSMDKVRLGCSMKVGGVCLPFLLLNVEL